MPEKYRTEVVPYDEAPWAPHLTGYRFRWAWRVLNEDGSVHICGASNGSAGEARGSAETAARRRIANNHGVPLPKTAVLRKPRAPTVDEDGLKSDGNGVADDGDDLSVSRRGKTHG